MLYFKVSGIFPSKLKACFLWQIFRGKFDIEIILGKQLRYSTITNRFYNRVSILFINNALLHISSTCRQKDRKKWLEYYQLIRIVCYYFALLIPPTWNMPSYYVYFPIPKMANVFWSTKFNPSIELWSLVLKTH